jgi:hypothetical protein
MDYETIDLKKITEQLADHYDPSEIDDLTGQCPFCRDNNILTWVDQTEDRCSKCGTLIVWQNSKLWKSIYGSDTERIREYRAVPPTSESGKHLIRGAGLTGWPSQADADTWEKAVKLRGNLEMTRIAQYVLEKHKGHPALRHAINIAKKKVREGKPSVPSPEPESNDAHPTLNVVTDTRW